MEGFTDVLAYLGFKSLMRCVEGWMMGFTERKRMSRGEQGRVSACVPFIAQLSRKSVLMERHLQGISPLLRWMGRDGGGELLKIEREATG